MNISSFFCLVQSVWSVLIGPFLFFQILLHYQHLLCFLCGDHPSSLEYLFFIEKNKEFLFFISKKRDEILA